MMKKLPKHSISYKSLFDMLTGQMQSSLLLTAIKLNVFDYMKEFISAEQIARKISSNPDNTRRFLDTLAMIDLIEKQNGQYRNTPKSALFLVQDSPQYIGELCRMTETMSLTSLEHLEELVLNGPLPQEENGDIADESSWASCTRATASWVYGETGQAVTEIIRSLPEAETLKTMLDLGGGHGIFTLYFIEALPGLKGIIFDRSPVLLVAQSFIDEYGMHDRVSVKSGDYLKDDIGSCYDLIWASATLNFAKDDIDPLITKIYNALNPGGYFVSFQDGLTDEHTKPLTMLNHAISSISIGKDFSFAQGEIADAMIRCGFDTVRSRTIDTPMGAMDMDIARKMA